ncbi:uncharacterized protein METZ01_LOCUS147936 [marine metagenome]|uniref:Uncharacterized protein n=1 Tax=marine metagenome TaxID=408172 RepID=A0A382A1P8_9ZZZZ|tara:strand:- start:435 stop:581 length:147 start_codon:yes stop_codon:yes gene_type:complete
MIKGQVKALVFEFDVGGSIFDWQTATRTAVPKTTDTWRNCFVTNAALN